MMEIIKAFVINNIGDNHSRQTTLLPPNVASFRQVGEHVAYAVDYELQCE